MAPSRLGAIFPLLFTSVLAAGCSSSGGSGDGGTQVSIVQTFAIEGKQNPEVDILFMIDNSSEMTEMQQKLYDQMPTFLSSLAAQPGGLPDLHIGVIDSDMGAPGDSTSSIGCTAMGDQGVLQSAPRSDVALTPPIMCTDSTLTSVSNVDHTYISDVMGMQNFTAPISSVLQCISLLGDTGCGFEHQLASIARALGADGQGPPSDNASFLRPEAGLAIVILSNEDDCSATPPTTLYSLNGGMQNLSNPLGPISNYRCNQFGHLCVDPAAGSNAFEMPPLKPPADAVQSASGMPTLTLTACKDNDTSSGMLTPVSQFVAGIKALKADPDKQIMVAAIIGPPTAYAVSWVPAVGGQNTQTGELWPQMEHSCGAAGGDVNPNGQISSDGSFGDPGVRLAQFASAFPQSALGSVCDADYLSTMSLIASKIPQLVTSTVICLNGPVQTNPQGQPACAVTEDVVDSSNTVSQKAIANCNENGDVAPCWTLQAATNCVGGGTGTTVAVSDDPAAATTRNETILVSCPICVSVGAGPGC
jgi:hypothetical protein